jgi:hypothetical protein
MKTAMWIAVVLSATFLWAQPAISGQASDNNDHGQVTVRGCISKSGGDYVLMKENPAVTYQLQASHEIRLSQYLGQRVEVSGTKSPTMSTSEDAMNKGGNASPVTLTVKSITTIDKECQSR